MPSWPSQNGQVAGVGDAGGAAERRRAGSSGRARRRPARRSAGCGGGQSRYSAVDVSSRARCSRSIGIGKHGGASCWCRRSRSASAGSAAGARSGARRSRPRRRSAWPKPGTRPRPRSPSRAARARPRPGAPSPAAFRSGSRRPCTSTTLTLMPQGAVCSSMIFCRIWLILSRSESSSSSVCWPSTLRSVVCEIWDVACAKSATSTIAAVGIDDPEVGDRVHRAPGRCRG